MTFFLLLLGLLIVGYALSCISGRLTDLEAKLWEINEEQARLREFVNRSLVETEVALEETAPEPEVESREEERWPGPDSGEVRGRGRGPQGFRDRRHFRSDHLWQERSGWRRLDQDLPG